MHNHDQMQNQSIYHRRAIPITRMILIINKYSRTVESISGRYKNNRYCIFEILQTWRSIHK